MRLMIFPKAIEIVTIIHINKGKAIHAPILPLGAIYVHIIIDKNTHSMSFLRLRIEEALISAIAIVDSFYTSEYRVT